MTSVIDFKAVLYRVRRSIVHSVGGAGQAILMGSRGLPDQSEARGRPRDDIYISAIGGGVLAAMVAAKLWISSQKSRAPCDARCLALCVGALVHGDRGSADLHRGGGSDLCGRRGPSPPWVPPPPRIRA
jgi:hypothetical protein